jgi:uncharacterized protein YbbK (DUF523 family)
MRTSHTSARSGHDFAAAPDTPPISWLYGVASGTGPKETNRMRMPHHPEILHTLRTPSSSDPWRVLVSGCIAGWPVGVNGTDYGLGHSRPKWLSSPLIQLVPFCPEDFQLGTPRTMPDLHGGDGYDVLDGRARVLDEHREDLTARVLAGAHEMVRLAQEHSVDFALLTDRSGVCGSQVVSVGCRYEEPIQYRKGVGVAAAALLRAGVHVVSQRDFQTLGQLRRLVEPQFVPDPDAVDHHQHPWVLEHLG